jgi:hypothetical protein
VIYNTTRHWYVHAAHVKIVLRVMQYIRAKQVSELSSDADNVYIRHGPQRYGYPIRYNYT